MIQCFPILHMKKKAKRPAVTCPDFHNIYGRLGFTLEKEMAAHSSVLAWRILGQGSLVGCRLWSHTELDTIEAT